MSINRHELGCFSMRNASLFFPSLCPQDIFILLMLQGKTYSLLHWTYAILEFKVWYRILFYNHVSLGFVPCIRITYYYCYCIIILRYNSDMLSLACQDQLYVILLSHQINISNASLVKMSHEARDKLKKFLHTYKIPLKIRKKIMK